MGVAGAGGRRRGQQKAHRPGVDDDDLPSVPGLLSGWVGVRRGVGIGVVIGGPRLAFRVGVGGSGLPLGGSRRARMKPGDRQYDQRHDGHPPHVHRAEHRTCHSSKLVEKSLFIERAPWQPLHTMAPDIHISTPRGPLDEIVLLAGSSEPCTLIAASYDGGARPITARTRRSSPPQGCPCGSPRSRPRRTGGRPSSAWRRSSPRRPTARRRRRSRPRWRTPA